MAIQTPPGPVYLSLPMDDMNKERPEPPPVRKVDGWLSAGPDVLASVAQALAAAKAPALVFGGAIDQAPGAGTPTSSLQRRAGQPSGRLPLRGDGAFLRIIRSFRAHSSQASVPLLSS